MKKPNPTKFATIEAYEAAMEKYNTFLAAKAERNRVYRERRTNRETKALTEAKALRANRDIDPTREEWLMRATVAILSHVQTLGFAPTGEVRVSIAPINAGRGQKEVMGRCYHASASEGGYREIFVSADLTDTRVILGVLTHEIGHAVLKDGVGHRKPFGNFCRAVGFEFEKAEFACNGNDWWTWASRIASELGTIPHRKLDARAKAQGEKKKQGTRLLLLECPCCGIKLRTTRKSLDQIVEATLHTIAACIDPTCTGKVDFSELMDLTDGDEEE